MANPFSNKLLVSFPAAKFGRLPKDQHHPAIFRLPEERVEEVEPGIGVRDQKTATVEAALFVADEPLQPRKLAKAAGLADAAEARKVLGNLQNLYDQEDSAFQVEEVAGGFQLLSRPQFHRWLVRSQSTSQEIRLSPAAKETLAIVAYRQPIMRAEIETIRGVHTGETLRQLMEKGLIRITGRHDSLGRPVLYGTTKKFLQIYGMKNLKDLPEVEDLKAGSGKKAKEGGKSGESPERNTEEK